MSIVALKDVQTPEHLFGVVDDSAESYPSERDGRYMLVRLYRGTPMNWCRSLEHTYVMRVIARNYGDEFGSGNANPPILIGLPNPADLFKVVWGIVPSFVKEKIKAWAKENKDGPIANIITEFVKRGLGLLPIPIPSFFINSIASLVIPPLVSYIISHVADLDTLATMPAGFLKQTEAQKSVFGFGAGAATFRMSAPHTSKSLKVMKALDHQTLIGAGLSADDIPKHLQISPNEKINFGSDTGGRYPNTLGQPDNRDRRTEMAQFYQGDVPNGCRPLQLMQVIAAQVRTNPYCDQDADTFGTKVWGTLDNNTKTALRTAAQATPPDRAKIADLVYGPVREVLKGGKYNVPGPILNGFTAMKVPEVVEWVILNQG